MYQRTYKFVIGVIFWNLLAFALYAACDRSYGGGSCLSNCLVDSFCDPPVDYLDAEPSVEWIKGEPGIIQVFAEDCDCYEVLCTGCQIQTIASDTAYVDTCGKSNVQWEKKNYTAYWAVFDASVFEVTVNWDQEEHELESGECAGWGQEYDGNLYFTLVDNSPETVEKAVGSVITVWYETWRSVHIPIGYEEPMYCNCDPQDCEMYKGEITDPKVAFTVRVEVEPPELAPPGPGWPPGSGPPGSGPPGSGPPGSCPGCGGPWGGGGGGWNGSPGSGPGVGVYSPPPGPQINPWPDRCGPMAMCVQMPSTFGPRKNLGVGSAPIRVSYNQDRTVNLFGGLRPYDHVGYSRDTAVVNAEGFWFNTGDRKTWTDGGETSTINYEVSGSGGQYTCTSVSFTATDSRTDDDYYYEATGQWIGSTDEAAKTAAKTATDMRIPLQYVHRPQSTTTYSYDTANDRVTAMDATGGRPNMPYTRVLTQRIRRLR